MRSWVYGHIYSECDLAIAFGQVLREDNLILDNNDPAWVTVKEGTVSYLSKVLNLECFRIRKDIFVGSFIESQDPTIEDVRASRKRYCDSLEKVSIDVNFLDCLYPQELFYLFD